jgi:hypothetical protein
MWSLALRAERKLQCLEAKYLDLGRTKGTSYEYTCILIANALVSILFSNTLISIE